VRFGHGDRVESFGINAEDGEQRAEGKEQKAKDRGLQVLYKSYNAGH
jgi:hypothetical protein